MRTPYILVSGFSPDINSIFEVLWNDLARCTVPARECTSDVKLQLHNNIIHI